MYFGQADQFVTDHVAATQIDLAHRLRFVGPDGERGWVKRGFLNSTPTANILLEQAQTENAQLADQIEKLGNSKAVIETYEKDMDAMTQQISALEAEKAEAKNAIASLEQQVVDVQEKLDRKLQNNLPPLVVLLDTLKAYWQYILPLIVVLMLICFLVSKAIAATKPTAMSTSKMSLAWATVSAAGSSLDSAS